MLVKTASSPRRLLISASEKDDFVKKETDRLQKMIDDGSVRHTVAHRSPPSKAYLKHCAVNRHL